MKEWIEEELFLLATAKESSTNHIQAWVSSQTQTTIGQRLRVRSFATRAAPSVKSMVHTEVGDLAFAKTLLRTIGSMRKLTAILVKNLND